MDDPMRAEVASNEVALPILGELRRTDHFEAGELRIIAGADALQFAPRAGVGEIHRARDAVRDALETGAVREKRLAVVIPGMAPGITTAAGEHLEPVRVRVESPDARAVQARDAMRRLDVAVGVDGLIHVNMSVVTPAQRSEERRVGKEGRPRDGRCDV